MKAQFPAFSGQVVHGKQIGSTVVRRPTANIQPDAGETVPARGVYAVEAEIDGVSMHGIMNIGTHPTFPEGDATIEVHLLDVHADLYGDRVSIRPVAYLRAERKFSDAQALAAQIAQDAAQAQEILAAREKKGG